jgi:hypothetical protein
MSFEASNVQSETLQYGLSITASKPKIDWSSAIKASASFSCDSGLTSTSMPGSVRDIIRLSGNQVIRFSAMIHPREVCANDFHIVVEPLAHATIVVQTTAAVPAAYRQRIILDADIESVVSLVLIQAMPMQSVADFDVIVNVQRGASVCVLSLDSGSSFVSRSIVSNLLGEAASCTQQVISLCDAQQHDLYTASNHAAPRTKSDILTRAAVLHASKSISRSGAPISSDVSPVMCSKRGSCPDNPSP